MSTADTNLPSPDRPATAAFDSGVAPRKARSLDVLRILIRREFWEHRVLWMAPVVIAVVIVACAFPAHIDLMHFDTAHDLAANQGNRMALFALMQWALTLPLYIVTVIVLNFYLVDCLFNERKDRSILFWKSLPVSDAATVASKLLVGLVVVPLGVYVLALATNLLFSAIWIARSSLHFTEVVAIWDTMTWLKVEALMLLGLLVSILWYAPLAAYLVLVSALARRSALLWATLPPVFVILAEKLALGTHHLTDLIEYRTWGIWQIMHLDEVTRHTVSVNGHEQHELVSLPAFFHAMDIGQVFANVDLWLGLAVAAVLAFAAVQIRRYRDDT